jgi:ABC transporter DrrB family efflux protein
MSVTTAPAAIAAHPCATTDQRHGAGFVASSLTVAKRTLIAFSRTPQLVVVGTIQGALFLLIFRYVFGGAIGGHHGVSYVNFMVPGFVVGGVLFSGMAAAAGVAEDVQRGVVDRLRSLPIPRASLAAGRTLAETVLALWGIVVSVGVGFAVGFRPEESVANLLVALALATLFGFAFSWSFITLGLVSGSAQAAQGMSMIVFPFTFVSSAYVAVDTLPGWMQPFARNQPVTAMIDSVRAWTLDNPVAVLGHSAGWLTMRAVLWAIAIVAVMAPIATNRYTRS